MNAKELVNAINALEQVAADCRKLAVAPKIVDSMNPKRPRALRDQRGFTLIDILFVVGLIGVLCSMAIPGLTRARGAAQASSALGTLRVINSAQLSFAITCGLGFYAPDLPTLGIKPPSATDAFLSPELSSAATVIKSGYNFTTAGTPLAGAPGTCNGLAPGQAAPGYVATADPLDPTQVPRFFGTNADGAIFEDITTLNGVMPETGAPASGAPIK
jgi:type II secretory pathway pseudopilin PulG